MSKFNIANLKKTIYYLKRNGLRDTYLAALERLRKKTEDGYTYHPPSEAVLKTQKEQTLLNDDPLFSILVPAYRTKESYLCAMIESVLNQSYSRLEMIIADASGDMPGSSEKSVEEVVGQYKDDRIRYIKLAENKGISENTNAALFVASGEYIGLLDHDDLLTPDALFEIAEEIRRAKESGITPRLLYSDEDKCDENGENYYEPHKKPDFNLDLILSNHYICHFTVMQAELMKKLGFRAAFDGAQDHDLVLRAVGEILGQKTFSDSAKGLSTEAEPEIRHIKKVLYHWRCHRGSTAENPASKQYAYEAGGRAIADFLETQGILAEVVPTKHLGFFKAEYKPDILTARADIGILGGRLLGKGRKITGGIYDASGVCPYEGLPEGFSGYMHRAALMQDAYSVDIRLMKLRPELTLIAEYILKASGCERKEDLQRLSDKECRELSIKICESIRNKGYRVVFNPGWTNKI